MISRERGLPPTTAILKIKTMFSLFAAGKTLFCTSVFIQRIDGVDYCG